MIIWLNGTFGVGKTSTAGELQALLGGSRLFDPETVGYMLQANLGDHPVSDFQHWPPWRSLVTATAVELAGFTGQHLIAVQTILVCEYLEEILTGLRAANQQVLHVLLDASEHELTRRIEASDEAREWRLAHLPEYRRSLPWLRAAADVVVDTSTLTAATAARQILESIPASLSPSAARPG